MRRLSVLLMVLVFVVSAAACGGKQEEAQKAAAEAKSTATSAGDAAAGMKQMADAFKQMADSASGDLKEVDPVSFRDLQTVLPEFGGWEKGSPTGEKMSVPISMSRTEVTYTKDEMSIEASVVDTGNRQMFFLPYMMMMAAGYEKESGTGYEKGTTIGGNPGFEKWDSESKDGELGIVVNKRFFVQLRGHSIQDNAVLREFMGKVDLGKLAGMK